MTTRTSSVFAGLLLLLACSRSTRGDREPPQSDLVAGGGSQSSGAGVGLGSDPEVGDEKCAPGDRRDATTEESGTYCLCVEDAGLRWRCFGPELEDPPAGGARGAPPAACERVFGQAGKESCIVQWGDCSDQHLYAIVCIEGACVCLVDNVSTAELEPMSVCPEDVDAINELCGWALEMQ
jgi:hypothetical protein